MNWLDLVMIIILLISTWQGLRTGLINGVARLLGLVIGIIVAFNGYQFLASYLNQQWGWGNSIATFLMERLPISVLDKFNNEVTIMEKLINNPAKPTLDLVSNDFINNKMISVTNQLAISILEVISFIILLIGVSLLVKLVLGLFAGAVQHTLLSPLDHLGGLLYGFLRGTAIILVLVLLLEPVITSGLLMVEGNTNIFGQAVSKSVLIPYALQVLDIINIQNNIWPSFGDVFAMGGCKYI